MDVSPLAGTCSECSTAAVVVKGTGASSIDHARNTMWRTTTTLTSNQRSQCGPVRWLGVVGAGLVVAADIDPASLGGAAPFEAVGNCAFIGELLRDRTGDFRRGSGRHAPPLRGLGVD